MQITSNTSTYYAHTIEQIWDFSSSELDSINWRWSDRSSFKYVLNAEKIHTFGTDDKVRTPLQSSCVQTVVGFVVKEKGDECQALSPNPIPGEFIVGSDSIKLSISKKSLNTALLWQL